MSSELEIGRAIHRFTCLRLSRLDRSGRSQRGSYCELTSGPIFGVGIHTDGYYAFSPCPSPGENIVLGNAVQLPLVGKRWRKVLTCLARSPDGRTASKEELVRELGYVKTGDLNRDQAEHDDGLIEKAKKAQDTLRATMADLASELRSLVATNGTSTVFQSEGDNYQAAFVARHLMPDQTRHLRFGSVE